MKGEPNLVSGVLVELFAEDAGFPENEPIVLPDGGPCAHDRLLIHTSRLTVEDVVTRSALPVAKPWSA